MKKRKIINIRPKTAALALTLTTILGGLGLINAHAEEATTTKPTDFEEPKYAHGLIIESEKQVTNLVNGLEYEIEDVEEASKKEVINVYGGGFVPRTIITEDENEVKEGEHTHKLGEWVAVNDVFEESYCPEDGTLVGRRNHLYHTTKVEEKINEDGNKEKVITGNCLTCGHEITLTRTQNQENKQEQKPNYNNGGSTSSNSGGSSRPTNPDKPVHTHYLGKWVSLNDDLEASYCPEDGVLVETRAHKYITNTNTVSNHDGTHTTTTTYTCSNCNHVKSESKTETKDCDYSKITYDDTYEYETCKTCGDKHTIGKHNLDKGTIDYTNSTITYSCTNPNCDYTKTEKYTRPIDPDTHKHTLGAWQNNGADEVKYCIDPACPNKGEAIETKGHAWDSWQDIDDSSKKRDCKTCDATETHTHTFGSNNETYTTVDATHHNHETSHTCTITTCNDKKTISNKVEECNFALTDSKQEGNIITETYSCQNGCGNSYTTTIDITKHTHTYGEWQDNGANEIRYCTATDCPDANKAPKTRDHTWGSWQKIDDDSKKRDCTTCNASETHTHSFDPNTSKDEYIQLDKTTHTHNVTNTCACGDKKIISSKPEPCSWTTSSSVTDPNTGITTITRSCICKNSKTETIEPTPHEHTFIKTGEEDIQTEEVCYVEHFKCSDANCGQTKDEYHGHQLDLENATGKRAVCDRCGGKYLIPTATTNLEVPKVNSEAVGLDDETKKILEKSNLETEKIKQESDAEAEALKQKSDEETKRLLEASDEETKRLLEESAKETAELLGTANNESSFTEEEIEDLTNKEIDAIIEETDNAIKEITDNADAKLAEAIASNNATDEVIDTIIEETDKAIADISEYADAKLAALIANRKTVLVRKRRSYR